MLNVSFTMLHSKLANWYVPVKKKNKVKYKIYVLSEILAAFCYGEMKLFSDPSAMVPLGFCPGACIQERKEK